MKKTLLACLFVTLLISATLSVVAAATMAALTYQPWGLLAFIPAIFVCCLCYAQTHWVLDRIWEDR